MSIPVAAAAKAVTAILTDEKARRTVGWIVVAILSPIIVLVALFCSILSGTSEHNNSILRLCFYGGSIPADFPAEYQACIMDMQESFARLDQHIAEINSISAEGTSLDPIRVKACFYAMYFGAANPTEDEIRSFADCFVTYDERTTPDGSDGGTGNDEIESEVPEEETDIVATPISDIDIVWSNILTTMGDTVTEEHRSNADSIYNLILYGSTTGPDGWIPGADVPFFSVDGFCSPVGSGWASRVTSEFGYRSDPFTGEMRGHTGIDIGVPTGTPIRAALPGTVTISQYNAGGYGYYILIDHGGGMETLYAHCSKLLAQVGNSVDAGDIIALSGSTGRSTGPHLHFEVRIDGQRINPRYYLPTV